MTRTLDAEPACPESADQRRTGQRDRRLLAVRRPFGSVPAEAWDSLAARSAAATPFARHAFHRAWWDAYGASAHDQTTVLVDPDRSESEIVAIAPLMHRHEVEPTDAATHTTMRHGTDRPLTPVDPLAKAIFFGASYHADYATILADPADLSAVAEALADHLAEPGLDDAHPMPWDVLDLRRLRCGDPAADEVAAAFGRRELSCRWTLNVEREDVCPVLALPQGGSFDDYLGTLGKKERHEIRRKVRRAETVGDVRLTDAADPLAELDVFIELHQKRWGDEGLFAPTAGGDASRLFFRRLLEEFGADGPLRLTFLTVGSRRIGAGMHFEDANGYLYYNAGVDPEARDLSPGVLMVARYIERALGEGRRRLDFLRGDEPYKYDWGAVDEPIQRVLVRRDAA